MVIRWQYFLLPPLMKNRCMLWKSFCKIVRFYKNAWVFVTFKFHRIHTYALLGNPTLVWRLLTFTFFSLQHVTKSVRVKRSVTHWHRPWTSAPRAADDCAPWFMTWAYKRRFTFGNVICNYESHGHRRFGALVVENKYLG